MEILEPLKACLQAGYLLGQLLEEHPAMSLVVVQETERFLFKPYTSAKAVYYAVVFLNQIVLSKRRGEGQTSLYLNQCGGFGSHGHDYSKALLKWF